MGKFLIFPLLWWITGNPFVALIILLVIFYILERRYVGMLPSIVKPFKRNRAIARLTQQIRLNPNDTSAKIEMARLLMDKKRFAEASRVLLDVQPVMEHSAEFWDDLGTAYLHTGEIVKGESCMMKAVEINPRVKYGEPYLRLASVYAGSDAGKALDYLRQFREIHSSSCKALYLLGAIYKRMGQFSEARQAFEECVDVYRTLPKYKKRDERQWMLRSFAGKLFAGSR